MNELMFTYHHKSGYYAGGVKTFEFIKGLREEFLGKGMCLVRGDTNQGQVLNPDNNLLTFGKDMIS